MSDSKVAPPTNSKAVLSANDVKRLAKWKNDPAVSTRAAENRLSHCKGSLFHPVTFAPLLIWGQSMTKRVGAALTWEQLPPSRQEFALYNAASTSISCEEDLC